MAAGERRQYAGGAAQTTLNGAITSGATTIVLLDSTGWPDGSVGPFFIVIDPGLAAEEKVKCVSRTGATLTVVTSPSTGRGADGTAQTSHVSGAVVQHIWTADDADKVNAHVNDLNDNHPSLLNVTRHDTTSRHPAGTVIGAGTPGNSAIGDVAAAGVSTNVARADHQHGREAAGGTPTSSVASDAGAAGSATTSSRSDHKHAREGYGTPGNSLPGDAIASGSATTVARSDHAHGREHVPTVGAVCIGSHASQIPYAQTGSATPTTNAGGGFTVTLPNAFGSGLASVSFTIGDVGGGTTALIVNALNSNHTLSAVQGQVFKYDGTTAGSTVVRINFTAWGWD